MRETGTDERAFLLVLLQVVREYETANDPEGLGRLLIAFKRYYFGEDYTPPSNPRDMSAFRRLLNAVKTGGANGRG